MRASSKNRARKFRNLPKCVNTFEDIPPDHTYIDVIAQKHTTRTIVVPVPRAGVHIFRLFQFQNPDLLNLFELRRGPQKYILPQVNGYPQHSQSYSHQRSSSVSHSGNGVAPTNGSNNRASVMAAPDDDDEYDRGHWGSKAEFILSCVGFSVSGVFAAYLNTLVSMRICQMSQCPLPFLTPLG